MDIRMETYKEALSSYLHDADGRIEPVGDPAEEIARYGLSKVPSKSVKTADYPAGTWFYYPEDGTVAVREVR